MMPREGTLIADRYRLERKVGGGRVSAVWRVRDEISSRHCAFKMLHRSMHKHPEALTRFSLEDRLARELTGPHFPERIGSGVWDGMRYIAWRWHEGESLRVLFERNPKQDAPTVYSIVQETCQALTLVHAAGYTHGDLKPENIIFADNDRSRQVKLLGFGVASRLARPSAAGFGVSRRRPGEVVGTPLYLSPDLILGRVPNGGQADLWALAVMVYEALTGRAPFLGYDIGAVLHAILEKRAPRPTSVADNLPGSFDTWWSQALAQEFETPSEFAGALARALAPALRTSHTQRSASIPERVVPPERVSPAPEALTAVPAAAGRVDTSTTATGIGPADLGMMRPPGAAAEASAAAPPRPSHDRPADLGSAEHRSSAEPQRASAEPQRASAEPQRASAEPQRSAPELQRPPEPQRPAAELARPAVDLPRPAEVASSTIETARATETARPTETIRPAADLPQPSAARPEPPPVAAVGSTTETFAPLPSPLRDFGGDGSRKTLVGITAPIALKSPAPAPGNVSAPTANAARAAAPNAIEGAPCRPIETGSRSLFDTALFGDGPRRPANPTVPFPRPRVAPRPTGTNPSPGGTDETPDIGRSSWHGTTTRTLRFVLTSPDHKPQRVAAALVCAAAALVIFAIGRSPIAGTAGIGQTTEALSSEPGQKPAQPAVLADPAPRSELATASGSDSMSELSAAATVGHAREPAALEADELAPGLVAPAREGGSTTRPVSDTSTADAAVPGGNPAKSTRPAGPAPAKSSAKKPTPPTSLPTPARKNSTELDFGI
jgi:serine/threonine protein kinase